MGNPEHDQEQAARVLADVFAAVEPILTVGRTTQTIDALVARELAWRGTRSFFLGYQGYPGHVTASINEEVINTVPSARALRDGDLLKLQIGVQVGKRYATQGWTYAIGGTSESHTRLVGAGLRALRAGIAEVKAGARVGNVSAAIGGELEGAGLAPSRHFVGHGMGERPHEEPPVPGWGTRERGMRLRAGQVLSIVVVGHAGSPEVSVQADGWNSVAVDGKPSVLLSRMVRVDDGGATPLVPERLAPGP